MADPEPWFRTFKFLTWELFAFFFFGASFRKAATARASQESSWAPPENRSVTTLAKSFFFFLTTEGKDVFVLKFLCGNPGAGRVRRCWFLARCPFVLLLSWGLASPSHGVRRQQVFSWDPAQLGTSVRSCRCGAATAQSCGDIAKLFLWCKSDPLSLVRLELNTELTSLCSSNSMCWLGMKWATLHFGASYSVMFRRHENRRLLCGGCWD